MRFKLLSNIEFDAVDVDDAFSKLAKHFGLGLLQNKEQFLMDFDGQFDMYKMVIEEEQHNENI